MTWSRSPSSSSSGGSSWASRRPTSASPSARSTATSSARPPSAGEPQVTNCQRKNIPSLGKSVVPAPSWRSCCPLPFSHAVAAMKIFECYIMQMKCNLFMQYSTTYSPRTPLTEKALPAERRIPFRAKKSGQPGTGPGLGLKSIRIGRMDCSITPIFKQKASQH